MGVNIPNTVTAVSNAPFFLQTTVTLICVNTNIDCKTCYNKGQDIELNELPSKEVKCIWILII